MKIWIFNNYNMLPEHGQFNRSWYLGRELKKQENEPVVFVGSHPHNTNTQLISGHDKFDVFQKYPFNWVLIKTCKYGKSKFKRILSMFQYYHNSMLAARHFERPDAIIGSSAHPLASLLAIRLGKKYNCKKIVEVRDLWPESIVEYGILNQNSILTKLLYKFEHYLYVHADDIIFTMEGAYEYILERGWQADIPKAKVHFINNGIDLETFEYNKEHYVLNDYDLGNPSTFKVIYTGSIRKVNNLGLLLDTAKHVKDDRVRFLIWGDGDEKEQLEERVKKENIKNVIFKGHVEKEYIPYIVSNADLNILHGTPAKLFRFGISPNKMFDYLAAGRAVLCDFPANYNPVIMGKAGVAVESGEPEDIAGKIEEFVKMDAGKYEEYCLSAKKTAEEYDFKKLTKKLIDVINRT